MEAAALELGRALDSSTIQKGLRELNADFAFDVAVNRPGEWENVIQFASHKALEAMRKNKLPVMWRDNYICGMDRGLVPEYKQWSVKEQVVEVPWSEADGEDVSVQWRTIPFDDPLYIDHYFAAIRGSDPSLALAGSGIVVRRVCMGYVKVPYKPIMLGWRHTFENILRHAIPGVSRASLGAKFGVDMLKYPCGSPQEIVRDLVEE